MEAKLTPAFDLAVEACRWNFRTGHRPRATFADLSVDWPAFLALARRHRIEGLSAVFLAANQLGSAEVLAALAKRAREIAVQNLQATAESGALRDRFEAAGLPLLFLKGLTVGALAYANPAIKAAIDIDILIDPADLGRAADLLRDRGYSLVAPRPSPNDRLLLRWHRHWKESVWSKGWIQIDLHTRLADNDRLIPEIDVHSPRQSVDVGGGVSLPTLASEKLFAYLAVHGASSAWFRLKWISDFAAILQGLASDDLQRIYARSQQLGAGRAAGQGLLLADNLFGALSQAADLRAEIRSDAATVKLTDRALKLLMARDEPTERRWGTWPIHRTQFDLLPGTGYKLSELLQQAKRLTYRIT